jgi:hypothetical protein
MLNVKLEHDEEKLDKSDEDEESDERIKNIENEVDNT